MKRFALALRYIIGALFIYAGAMKIQDPAGFGTDIDHYWIVPYFATGLIAIYLPWLEVVCGLAMIGNRARAGAQILVLTMSGVFTIALGAAWARGLDINCGCFGRSGSPGLPLAFARAVLLCGAMVFLIRDFGQTARDPSEPK